MAKEAEDLLHIRLVTALVIIGTFVAGGLVGAGLDHLAMEHHRPPPPSGLPLRELGLPPEQLARAEAIVEKHRGELEAIFRDSFPKVRAVEDQIEREVRAILTPDQAARLDLLKARRPPHHGHGPHGEGPGFGPHGEGPGFGPHGEGPGFGPHDPGGH